MKKLSRIILFSLLGILIIFTFVFLWKKSQPQKFVYEILVPTRQNIEKKTVATGKVEPRDEVLIKPQISGIITELYKHAGERVTEGEVIAKVKVIPEMGQLNQAQSEVRQSKINLEQAQQEYDRVKELYDGKVISKEEFEKAVTALKTAKENLQRANDNLEIVTEGISRHNSQYNNTMVRSTITGMILDIPVKVGNSVIQSNTFNDGTTIASVANMSDMIFKGNIDETEVGRVRTGMPIKLTVGALQDKQFDAQLEYIAPKATEENGAILFEIKAAAQIPDSVFVRAGYSANAEIILDRKENVLSIPERCIEFSNDSTFVYEMTGSEKDPIYTRRWIKTGLSDGINMEIKEGLSEKMIIRGNKIDK